MLGCSLKLWEVAAGHIHLQPVPLQKRIARTHWVDGEFTGVAAGLSVLTTGETFGRSTKVKVATNTVHHAGARASHIVLPVIPE